MDDVMSALVSPQKLWSRSGVLTRPCPVPTKPGIYAWYFDDIPPIVPIDGCVTWGKLTLLYIGISPAKPSNSTGKASQQNLRKRIQNHLRGNAYGSTLRMTLGCLLRDNLGIQLHRLGSGKRIHFAAGEKILSQWMDTNAFVIWVVQEKPWEMEERLIGQMNLPLNLRGNENHLFYSILSRIRKDCKQEAS